MPSIFRFLAHPRHFPGPAFPGEANSACRSLGRATPKRSGVLSHCRPRAKTQALCQPVASRRPAAALQALAGALSLDGVPLVPARSRGLPDPIARRLLPHPHFCPSEDSRPILHDPELGVPRARWSQRRPTRMAASVFVPTRQECGGFSQWLGRMRQLTLGILQLFQNFQTLSFLPRSAAHRACSINF